MFLFANAGPHCIYKYFRSYYWEIVEKIAIFIPARGPMQLLIKYGAFVPWHEKDIWGITLNCFPLL